MNNLSPSMQRFVAVSLLALLVLTVFFYGLLPLAKYYLQKSEDVQFERQQLNRFEFLLSNEDVINAELARIDELGSRGDLFLSGNKLAIASANLREFVNEALQRSGGQLVSSQEYEAGKIEAATAVGLRLQVSGEVHNLVDFLYELETARPLIFIDKLAVTSSSSRIRNSRVTRMRRNQKTPSRSNLDIRLDIVGYLAGEVQ